MLKSAGNEAVRASGKMEDKDIYFDKMYSHVRDNLKTIDSQEVAVACVLNEEYDDWYDDNSEKFYYEDNDGISDMLVEACDFVHIYLRALLNGYGSGTYFERDKQAGQQYGFSAQILRRQFAEVLDKGLSKLDALGWTGTFMKQGIALYLL